MSHSVKVYNLAKFMHERMETLSAEEHGVDLNEQPDPTPFDDLPEEHLRVMIGLAGSVIEFIKDDLMKSSRIIS